MVTSLSWALWGYLAVQRLWELAKASRNNRAIRAAGGTEFGGGHYPWMVLFHALFFLFLASTLGLGARLSPRSLPWLGLFAAAQSLRFWSVRALGQAWSTRVWAEPGRKLVASGPYRFLRHPIYLAVSLELLSVPMAYGLGVLTLPWVAVGGILLCVRIAAEKEALALMASVLLGFALSRRAPAQETEPIHPDDAIATPVADLPQLSDTLERGNWNERIHAVHRLGRMGQPALLALHRAAQDVDWQVRLTATHWLGRVGKPAIEALDWTLVNDPCRILRLSALHWLGSLGPDALPSLNRAMEDESRLLRLNGSYWLRKDSAQSDPAELRRLEQEDHAALEAEYDEDLNVCSSSDRPGLLSAAQPAAKASPAQPPAAKQLSQVPKDAGAQAAAPSKPEAPKGSFPDGSFPYHYEQPVKAPAKLASIPKEVDRLLELDTLLPEEKLPPAAQYPGRLGQEASALKPDLPGRALGKPELEPKDYLLEETLPDPGAGLSRGEITPRAKAILLEGQHGLATHDAIPDLILALKKGDVLLRFRAADELGKMGRAAEKAVPALMQAMKDKSARVRASAALALGNIGPAAEAAVGLLSRALKDKSVDVRHSAALALGRMGTPKARRAFERHVREEARRNIENKP